MKTSITKIFLLFGYLILIPEPAHANAGVPMLFLVMPAFAISIIPIIAIEAIYLSRKLKFSGKVAGKTATISNLVSTIIGIPLTWIILVIIQIVTGGSSAYGINNLSGKILAVTWQAPWLIPYESELNWMIPAGGAFLLIPFFFVSWWSEYFVSKKIHKDLDKALINKAVRNANLITYGLLTIWPIVMLLFPKK